MEVTSQPGQRFHEREDLLDFLLEASAITAETLDLDKLLPLITDLISRVITHDVSAILLYTQSRQGLKIRYARGHRDEVVRNLVIPIGEGITGAAAAKRQPVLSNDVLNDSRYLATLDAVRSELAVPMIARGKLVGVIDVQSTSLNAFTQQDVALLRLLAARIAASIDNARLYKRIERQSRTSRILLRLAQEFSATLQLDELLGKIAKAVRALIDYDAFSILLVDPDQRILRHRFSERYDERVSLDSIPIGKGITGAAVESREMIKVDDTLADSRYIASHPGIRSEVAVPLIAHDRVIGVMDLESSRLGYFRDEHIHLLTLLSAQVAISVENARLYEELGLREQRMEQDLKAASKVQSVLLPVTAPKVKGLQMAIASRPAREISGDLYDFFVHGTKSALIAFGDSSGKGAAAALYGALVSGLLRTLGFRRRHPSELLRLLNNVLLERKVDAQYVTLLLVDWDADRKMMRMANAGSTPPVICRDGEHVKIRLEGVPLGLLEDREYDEIGFETRSGDVILLHSDGFDDQVNPKGEEYGHARIFRSLKALAASHPKAIAEGVFADLDRFMAGAPVSDDQTLIVIKVN
jgi:phosphoserine phosphatase RsbU/P